MISISTSKRQLGKEIGSSLAHILLSRPGVLHKGKSTIRLQQQQLPRIDRFMSTQVNFFCVSEDWNDFAEFFRRKEINYWPIKTLGPTNIGSEHPWLERDRWPLKIGLAHSNFADNIRYSPDPHSGGFALDVYRSCVIECDTGGFYPYSADILHRSRFYAVNDYFTRRGEHITKDEQFKKWVQQVYRSFKREFLIKSGDWKVITFTQRCLKWMDENNAVVGGGALTIIKQQNSRTD